MDHPLRFLDNPGYEMKGRAEKLPRSGFVHVRLITDFWGWWYFYLLDGYL